MVLYSFKFLGLSLSPGEYVEFNFSEFFFFRLQNNNQREYKTYVKKVIAINIYVQKSVPHK